MIENTNEPLNIIRKFISGEDYPPDDTMLEFFEEFVKWLYKKTNESTSGPYGAKVSSLITDISNGIFEKNLSSYLYVQVPVLSKHYITHEFDKYRATVPHYYFEIKNEAFYDELDSFNDDTYSEEFFDLFESCSTYLSNVQYTNNNEEYFRIERIIDEELFSDIEEKEDDEYNNTEKTYEDFFDRLKIKFQEEKDWKNILYEMAEEFMPGGTYTYHNSLDLYKLIEHNRLACFKISRKEGLYRVNKKKNRRSRNVIDDLLSINKTNIKELNYFFYNYGFFYPLYDDNIYKFDGQALLSIVDRIKDVYFLQQEITCYKSLDEFDFGKIIITIFSLLFSQNYVLEIYDPQGINTCKNRIWDRFIQSVKLDRTLSDDMKIKYNPYNGFNLEKEYPTENLTVKEFINKLLEYSENKMELFSDKTVKDIVYVINWFNKTFGSIDNFYDRRIFHNEREIEINTINNKIKHTSPEFKEKIIVIAKSILTKEINYKLSNISIKIDDSTLKPHLVVDSLISAIYLSISYYNSNYISVRRCFYCGNYFSCNTSSSRKFCSNQCSENYKSQNRRAKEKLKEIRKRKKNS